MLKINDPRFLSALFCLILLCSLGASAFGQEPDPTGDYRAAARDLLERTRAGLLQAQQACQSPEACSPDFQDLLGQLQSGIDRLDAALSQTPSEIRDAINNLSPIVQSVCNQIGSCTPPPAGVSKDIIKENPDPPQPPIAPCEGGEDCGRIYRACQAAALRQRDQCIKYYDDKFGCWIRVPFCDPSAPYPFDPSLFSSQCQRFIGRDIPACRCSAPWTERQGGCPEFFSTGTVCPACTFQPCSTLPPGSASCQRGGVGVPLINWNYNQCDVCRWFALGYSTINLTKKLFCEKPYTEQLYQCRLDHLDCRTGATLPPICR